MIVDLEIVGQPAPQGDKSAVLIGGKARLIEGRRGEGRERHKTWRTVVADAARDAVSEHGLTEPLDGPLRLYVEFRMAMPASRPKRTRVLGRGWKEGAPDLDKLLRALGDSLKDGGLIRDDARIVNVHARKVEVIGWTGALVTIGHEGEQP